MLSLAVLFPERPIFPFACRARSSKHIAWPSSLIHHLLAKLRYAKLTIIDIRTVITYVHANQTRQTERMRFEYVGCSRLVLYKREEAIVRRRERSSTQSISKHNECAPDHSTISLAFTAQHKQLSRWCCPESSWPTPSCPPIESTTADWAWCRGQVRARRRYRAHFNTVPLSMSGVSDSFGRENVQRQNAMKCLAVELHITDRIHALCAFVRAQVRMPMLMLS